MAWATTRRASTAIIARALVSEVGLILGLVLVLGLVISPGAVAG